MKGIKLLILLSRIRLLASGQTPNRDMLDVKIGQMILIGFPKAEVDPMVLEEIKTGKVGSIILFEKNVPKGSASFNALKKMLWTYQKAAPIPLLICVDQEGGKVNRLKDKYGFPKSVTAQDMGRAKTLDSVRFYAESIASNLAGLGFNVNFAPDVDLGVNKENTVVYKNGRTFSADPDSVVLLATEYIKPHRKYGVITTLKHFPGHGSSMADTHFGVADVTNTWTEKELIPFQKLIMAGEADAIMSAHIVNMKLDPKGYPGTLSYRMIDSLLRKQLHFNGVVFSDDMQMQAISKQYGLEETIKLAINAGIDILCFSNNIQGTEDRTVDKVHAIIRSLVESGQIKQERIDESFERIMKLKSKLGYSQQEALLSELNATRMELQKLQESAGVNKKEATEVKEQKADEKPAEEQTDAGQTSKKKKKKK